MATPRISRAGAPTLGQVRIADLTDVPYVMELCNESMKTTFRVHNVHDLTYLIENSVLSITQMNNSGDAIGFLSVREYPLIPSVHPTAWEEYIWSRYKTIDMNGRNTLFIHMLCWHKAYSRDVVDSMLRSVFMHDPYVHFIAMVKTVLSCPQLVAGSSRAEASFRRVQAMERGVPGDQLPALLLAERKDVCPRLRVRRAVEEDNDDIVPIIERHSERLRELYGNFYVSELIARHPESDRVLVVCEHKELAVGVMCLNTQINFDALEESFDLSPFAGLRHLEQVHEFKKTSIGDSSSFVITDPNDMWQDRDSTTVIQPKFQVREEEDRAEQAPEELEGVDSSMFAVLNYFDDEEEELEFDIINIDMNVLMMPDFISPDENISKNILTRVPKESLDDVRNVEKRKPSPSTAGRLPEYTHYTGASNAFLLEMCAMHEDYDERYAFDMLEATYELFPDRDYCVMCLPSSHTSFPLLEHFTLVTPRSVRMRFINESLYVAHINSIRGDVSSRFGEPYDLENLEDILEHAPRKDTLFELFQDALLSRSLDAYILLSQRQPVGVVIVGFPQCHLAVLLNGLLEQALGCRPLEDGVTIRTQYDLEPESRRPGTDGTILGGVLSPALEPHSRWYLRDIMRQSRYTTLFWICQPFAKGDQSPKANLMSLAERMVPVRPRRSLPNITGDRELDRIYREQPSPFALWVIERPLSSYPKVYVNNSIVVVGASRTGLAFLETLIIGPTSKYLTFTNLTLVSEHGLPTVADCLKAAVTCLPQEGRYTDHYLKSVPFCFYLDVLPAVVVAIDRKKKCIHFKSGGVKYYDELVLTCGQQFQHPDYLKEPLENVRIIQKGLPCVRMLMDDPQYQPDRLPPPPELPTNVFLINSLYQANLVLRKLLRMMASDRDALNEDNRIIVYGDCLEAYCCISGLIELGVAGYEITFVENFPPEDPAALRVNCFNDETVDERVQQSLDSHGVRLIRQSRLVHWEMREETVISIQFMAPMQIIEVPCYALFYFGLKAIDIHAFKAINECGLVYDGGLVVGPMFDTNDPHIYGAGTFCNYSRRLYASKRLHRYYNSEDVGEALAQLFLQNLNPFVVCHPEFSTADLLPLYRTSLYSRAHPSIPQVAVSRLAYSTPAPGRKWQQVMTFDSPIVKSATLPGPLYYMKVRKPGIELPMEVRMILPHQGHTLITDKQEELFRLQLNVLHCVDSITCLCKKPFSSQILTQLYGKHEAYFNKLLLRYQMQQIDDLYSFFLQPWMAAIYQENFDELIENINEHEIGAIYDLLRSKYAFVAEDMDRSKIGVSTCFETPECQIMKRRSTLRSVLNKYATKRSVQVEKNTGSTDIPKECGQSAAVRDEVGSFWDAMDGERIVFSYIARHIARNSITNPHFAPPKPEYF